MLSVEQIQAIKELIDQAKQLIDEPQEDELLLRDYVSLIDYMLAKELEREINHLEVLLEHPKTFKEEFKKSCRERAVDPYENGFNFNINPESQTNKLYWEIAHLTFDAHEVAGVLFPNVRAVSLMQCNDQMPFGQTLFETKNYLKNPPVKLISQPVVMPDLAELPYFVITEDQFFDVRSVYGLPLIAQEQVQSQLNEKNPELACKLYSHNETFKALEADLHLLQCGGQTVRQAIEQLAKGLFEGRSNMSFSDDAQKPAQVAYLRFFEFFNTLPETAQENLNQLQGDHSLAIILNELKHGQCVETVARDLLVVLQRNQNNPYLDTHFAMNHEIIAGIFRVYKKDSPLECKKDTNYQFQMPQRLAQEAFRMIFVELFSDWLILLLHCPSEIYTHLFKRFTKETSYGFLNVLEEGLQYKVFNANQLDGLITAIINPNGIFKTILDRMDFAITCKCRTLLEVVIAMYSSNEEFLHDMAESNYILFYDAFDYPEALEVLMPRLIRDERCELVTESVLGRSVDTPEAFLIILSCFSESTDLIRVIERGPVFYAVAPYPALLGTLLQVYPNVAERRAVLLRMGNSILTNAASSPESIKILLELFDESERFSVVLKYDEDKVNLLQLAAAKNPQSLEMICSLLSTGDAMKAVKYTDDSGRTLLYYARSNSDSVTIILSKLSEAERYFYMLREVSSGCTVLECHPYDQHYHQLIKTLLKSLTSEKLRLQFVKHGKTPVEQRMSFNKDLYDHILAEVPHDDTIRLYCSSMRVLRTFYTGGSRSLEKELLVLRTRLEKCNNKKMIRKDLLDFLNIDSLRLDMVQKELLNVLNPTSKLPDYRHKLKELSELWEIKPKSLYFHM